jgi:heptosyltransferase-2
LGAQPLEAGKLEKKQDRRSRRAGEFGRTHFKHTVTAPSAIRDAHPGRILVRGVNWLGDAVMTTPALLRLREATPGAHITLLTHEKLAGLWSNHPAVDAVVTFSKRDPVWSVARKLRAGHFQTGLTLANSPRSALELWLARIPRRIGYARPWRNCFLTSAVASRAGVLEMRKRSVSEIKKLVAIDSRNTGPASADSHDRADRGAARPAEAHQIHDYLHLAAALGANPDPLPPRLEVTTDEVAAARQKFALANDVYWLGLNPGAEYGPAKRWPLENFLWLAREAAAWPGWGVVVFGGEGDIPITDNLEQQFRKTADQWKFRPRFVNLSGRTSLRGLCACLKLCRVLVTNDTGPMHAAAALGTSVVAVFGSTSPELTGPGLPDDPRRRVVNSDVPCSPCFRRECPIDFRCMKSIETRRVAEAIFSFGGTPGGQIDP